MRESFESRRGVRIAPNAEVDSRADVGTGTTIWGLACIREDAVIGRDCIIGRGAYIEDEVSVGDRVKIQGNALIYKPAQIGDDVFIGPGVILANDRYPRSSTPDRTLKRATDWKAEGVLIGNGASVGAQSVVLPGIRIGRYAMVAAGATVTRDVPDFAIVAGAPARRVGWAGVAGLRLNQHSPNRWICPLTGEHYTEHGGNLKQDGSGLP